MANDKQSVIDELNIGFVYENEYETNKCFIGEAAVILMYFQCNYYLYFSMKYFYFDQ